MKFLEFYNKSLNEAKIDDLLTKSNLDDTRKVYIREINELLDNKSKYVQWLINNLEGLEKYGATKEGVASLLNYFDKYQSRFDEKDIMKYDATSLQKTKIELEKKLTKSQRDEQASKDATKVFENNRCIVLNIKSEKASNKYGKGTKWCISAEQNNQWNNYTKNGYAFYFLIPKAVDESKYAFAVSIDGNEIACFNAEDARLRNFKKSLKEEYGVDWKVFKPMEPTLEQMLNPCIYGDKTWKMNEDGTIDTKNYVEVHSILTCNRKLRVKFGITGSFRIPGELKLTSLEGCPREVDGEFACHHNNIHSLEGGPRIVKGLYNCSHNSLGSLEGGPEDAYSYDVSGNFLTSLKGCPKELNELICSTNRLTSLEGGPEKVKVKLSANGNRITSLKGCPILGSKASIFMESNNLTSLEGLTGNPFHLYFGANNLTSLEGCPKEEIMRLDVSHNDLESFKGCPKKIRHTLDVSNNRINTLEGFPESIGVLKFRENAGYQFTEEDFQKVGLDVKKTIIEL